MYFQQLNLFRFYGAEPPTCVRQDQLAIESETGPLIKTSLYYTLFFVLSNILRPISLPLLGEVPELARGKGLNPSVTRYAHDGSPARGAKAPPKAEPARQRRE